MPSGGVHPIKVTGGLGHPDHRHRRQLLQRVEAIAAEASQQHRVAARPVLGQGVEGGMGGDGRRGTVMGWTPPDGIWVPRWRCRPTTRGGVRGTG